MPFILQRGIFACFMLFCFSAFGQEYYANVRDIGQEEGLSHYNVFSFYPENDGMWIGTEDGLNFYDGYTWKYWKKSDGQLSSSAVNFIHKDQGNCLWAFHTAMAEKKQAVQSINILSANREDIFSFKEKLGDQAPFDLPDIQNFFEDQQHHLYFFAKNQLWQYTPSQLFKLVPLPDGFEPYSIFSDGSFIGKLQHKLALVSAIGEVIYTSNYTLSDKPYDIIGNQEQFWFWQKEASCQVFKKLDSGTYQNKLTSFQSPTSYGKFLLHFDEQREHIWILQHSVIQLYNTAGQFLYEYPIKSRVACVDENDNLWFGKFQITLLRLQKNKFRRFLYQDPQIIPFTDFNNCRGIIEKKRNLYVNTNKGLRVINLDTEEFLPSPIPDIWGSNLAMMLSDPQDQIWLAYKRLFQLDTIGSQIVNAFGHLEENLRIWALFQDREDRIWMGKLEGLSYLDGDQIKSFKQYNEFTELAEALVLFFFKDKNGVIWVAGDKGLYQLDLEKGIFAGYGKNRKGAFHLPSDKFQHLYQDAQGILWLATADVGLLRWDRAQGEIQQFDKNAGMPTNNIYAVYEDDYGFLWLSSFNGLIRFHKTEHSIHSFYESDGISGNEFNRTSHFQAADGSIYFGGQNGLTTFHPKDFLKEKSEEKEFTLTIKHTSIFGLKVQKDTLADGAPINLMDLNPGARVIDLEIGYSDLFWTDRVDLHYSLEQLDQSQNVNTVSKENISSDNHIELFGMHPGRYNLQIKAIQKNGQQLGAALNVPIDIAKPIYHTALFWLGVLLALCLGIWVYLKVKTARLQKRQAELEILVTQKAQQILEDQQTIQTQAEEIEAMKGQLNRKDEMWLEQFQAIIAERLEDSELYLPDIIDDMDISRSLFYEKVKTLTKMTPNQYIQELRLTKAKTLLDAGEIKTVKEVAHAIGMKNPSYFSKRYKERFGITPSAYFRSHKANPY